MARWPGSSGCVRGFEMKGWETVKRKVAMESIIELQRQEHEEVERYEQALADILNKQTTGVSFLLLASFVSELTLMCCGCSGGENYGTSKKRWMC
jgi:hypothetical protein